EAGRKRVVSEETRAKMSAAQKGRTLSEEARAKLKGRSPSAETRAKMSAAQKGHILSEQARAKVIQALTGRSVSEETRARISAARKASPLSEESRRRIVEARRVLTPEQVQEIRRRLAHGEAIRPIAEAYGVNYYTIWNILKGKTWTHLPPPDDR